MGHIGSYGKQGDRLILVFEHAGKFLTQTNILLDNFLHNIAKTLVFEEVPKNNKESKNQKSKEKEKPIRKFDLVRYLYILIQIFVVFKKLLECGISPRDIRLADFLLTKGDHVLLTNLSDLGLTKGENDCAFNAPEIFI